MKYNTNRSLTSSNPLKNLQNRGKSEKLSDNSITGPIEVGISRIKANFGNFCQNTLNFVARVGLLPAQKTPNTHQKTTAIKARRGFVNFI